VAAHPGVTSAIIGPHTMEQLKDLLASADVTLADDILDQIDEIVLPGTDVGTLDQAFLPPALLNPTLRRRPVGNAPPPDRTCSPAAGRRRQGVIDRGFARAGPRDASNPGSAQSRWLVAVRGSCLMLEAGACCRPGTEARDGQGIARFGVQAVRVPQRREGASGNGQGSVRR
jgi:hypothetical protein